MADKSDRTIRVGSRKSQLALIQTRTVIESLKQKHPEIKFETITMQTMGDKILDTALSKIGEKSLFTRELEDALLKKRVDFCVHSLKDLPTEIPQGLVIGGVLKRDNPLDAVVMNPKHRGKKLEDLPPGSVIGTSALRRAAQLKRRYPHFNIENIRGNLNTRFRKLSEAGSNYDAMILAVSGLERMGWQQFISQVLDPKDCMYAVSQGALAVECRDDDAATLELMAELQDLDTALSCVAERSFLRTLEGGCSVPVAVLSEKTNDQMMLKGAVFSISGEEAVLQEKTYDLMADLTQTNTVGKEGFVSIACQDEENVVRFSNALKLGHDLACSMMKEGADVILREAKAKSKEEILAEHEKKKRKAEEEEGKREEGGGEGPPSSSAAKALKSETD